MSESLFSQHWYRVARLRPRLRAHTRIHRHRYRGELWYVLQDDSTGQFHRFSPEAYLVIAQMDGRRSLEQIWEAACETLGDDMPTQDEIIALLGQLHRADVLQADMPPDIASLYERAVDTRRKRLFQQLRSPLGIRIPLFDPDRLLDALMPLLRPLGGRAGALLWLLTVLSAALLAAMHWEPLTGNLADRVLSTENLLLLWFVYPLVKAIHEFGHAVAVKQRGGEVHEMGVMLLVFMPVPYVDASAASGFRDKHARMLVGAAGILVEMFLAAVAMIVWVNVEPGLVRAIAFNTMLIAGVSTLLFNGNPLLRFDAYYVLADYLELPNLGARANRYLGYLIKRYLLGVSDLASPVRSGREAAWMVGYALASFVYRIFIMGTIALFVAGKFFFVGVLLAVIALVGTLGVPLAHLFKAIHRDPDLNGRRGLAWGAMSLAAALLGAILLWLPLPSSTVTQAVVWAPDESRLRAGEDGFVAEVLVEPGSRVRAGDPLVICRHEELLARRAVVRASLGEARARYQQARHEDRTRADIAREEVRQLEQSLRELDARVAELTIRSPRDGVLLMPDFADLPGRYLQRGSLLGYVVDFDDVRLRAVVRAADVDRVRNHTRRVDAYLSSRPGREWRADVRRQVPAATRELPSLALAIPGGGDIALDPEQGEQPLAFEPLFQFELALPGVRVERIGERVWIRFRHEPEALWPRLYRAARRLLLRRLEW